MLVLYITYIDFGKAMSGSSVRPQKMYQAFLDAGYEVKLLSGSQNNDCREKRRQAIAEVMDWLKVNSPDCCYVESPVYPILLKEDIALLRKIHQLKIPMGYFYRDFYWMFPDLYPLRKDLVGWLKDNYLMALQRRTDKVLRKTMDVVYFPSQEATNYFHFSDMRALPPAGEMKENQSNFQEMAAIYVGGISDDYGGEMMLESFALLNRNQLVCKLILVCRESEWQSYEKQWGPMSWLEVHHVSGEALTPLYQRASFALLPVLKNPYTDISVNVKIYEYMSFSMPVVSTNVNSIASIVTENHIGLVAEDNPESFSSAILQMVLDSQFLHTCRENAQKALVQGNLWVHRARQVVENLKGK